MNLWTLLERTARAQPNQIAAIDGELRVSYAEVFTRCASLAAGLRQHGVERGDRIAILEPNSLAFFEAYWAAAAIGAILVPLNTRLTLVELAKILNHSGSRVLLAHGSFALQADGLIDAKVKIEHLIWTSAAPAECRSKSLTLAQLVATSAQDFVAETLPADHVAQLYYTSGTTGEPKGVMLTHGNIAAHSDCACAEFQLSETDVWIHVAPMFHLADAWATFAFTSSAATHVFCPRFDERAVLDSIVREGVTMTNLVPTMLQRLVSFEGAALRSYPSLRMLLSGGAPIAPSVVRRIVETFRCEYVQTYGMTETSPFLTLSLLKPHLRSAPAEVQFTYRAKTGRRFSAVELAVIGDDGLPIPADGIAVGEIRARGPTVTPGYWNDPAATTHAFENGWLLSGDLATIDSEGYLQIVDRKKDMIISGGEKVYSTEVEHVLYAHPAVLECAVFGVADATWGECVEAAVVLRPGARASSAELQAYARQQLAGFKVPRRIRFLDELPKTGTGKIAKRWLRDCSRSSD